MTNTEVTEEALKLSVEERLTLAEKLWYSVEEDAASLPLYDWQKKLLDERLVGARQNPDAWLTWEEVKARVLTALKKQPRA